MANQAPTDLRLLSEVRGFLQGKNDEKAPGKPAIGSFSYFAFPVAPKNQCDEVYPGILLGNGTLARQPDELQKLGVTHVVNAAMGKKFNQIDTNPDYFQDFNITFHGVPALDILTFKLYPNFHPTADFIEEALANQGKVYVHCQQGVSRSASLVLAFLILKRNMDLLTAVKDVRSKREIFPNEGFLKQLCRLNMEVHEPEKLEQMDS